MSETLAFDAMRETVAAQIAHLSKTIEVGEHDGWIIDYCEDVLVRYRRIQTELDAIKRITDNTF